MLYVCIYYIINININTQTHNTLLQYENQKKNEYILAL